MDFWNKASNVQKDTKMGISGKIISM